MCLYRHRANVLHFSTEVDKLAPGMVYHSKNYQFNWGEVARTSVGHLRVASFPAEASSLRFCGTVIYPCGIQHLLDVTCFVVSGLSSPANRSYTYLD